MVYSQPLAERVRMMLPTTTPVEAKPMMGGLIFMINGKMCVGIVNDELMVRCGPSLRDTALANSWCRPMTMTGRTMRNFVVVAAAGVASEEDLAYWLELALDFNQTAKATKKRSQPRNSIRV